MKNILILFLFTASIFIIACGSNDKKSSSPVCSNPDSVYCVDGVDMTPTIGVRSGTGKTVITVDGLEFKDSDGDAELDSYEDWRLSASARADDLVSKMSLNEQIGLLDEGGLSVAPDGSDAITTDQMTGMDTNYKRCSLLRYDAAFTAKDYALQIDGLQEYAEAQPLGVPMLICCDPVGSAGSDMNSTTLTHQNDSPQITNFPTKLGMGAINDANTVKAIGRSLAAEYRSIGIRMLLGPQCDIATEPRWARVYDVFGSDPTNAGNMVKAFIQGLQGEDDDIDPLTGVAATIKHFPGSGSVEDGMDSHTADGMYSVFPGQGFDLHLKAFKIAFEANPACVMPCYSIYETSYNARTLEGMGASYSKIFMIDILRNEIGWDGMVTSDWGAIGACYGTTPPLMETTGSAWGLETENGYTNADRMGRYIDAGGHQLGFWADGAGQWVDALDEGTVTEAEVANCAKKVLEVMFKTGLFENPYTSETTGNTAAQDIIDSHAQQAHDDMIKAMTLLKNSNNILPLDSSTTDQNGTAGIQVYFDGFTEDALLDYTEVLGFARVTDMAEADYAIIRVSARQGNYFGLDGGVPLAWDAEIMEYDQTYNYPSDDPSTASSMGGSAADNNADWLAVYNGTIQDALNAKTANPSLKLIFCVYMPRPFIIEPILDNIDVLLVEFGATDAALLDLVFRMNSTAGTATPVADSGIKPTGKLPMSIPASDLDVWDAAEDLPDDETNLSFKRGAGLSY